MKKRVLIIGKESYIGDSINRWLNQQGFHKFYEVNIVSSKNGLWKEEIARDYHTVINVAGIAHVKIKKKMENMFYIVNRDLAVDICLSAKSNHVSQYIYLSSMNVFGDTNEKIDANTIPRPQNFYGKSKLEADERIQQLNTEEFHVVSLRPPVVYGKNCKGNFPLLIKGAKILPLFPEYKNTRSLIFIENLCEFIRLSIDKNIAGIHYPQNIEQVSTTDIMRLICKIKCHKKVYTKFFNPLIKILMPKIHFLQRIFDDDYYDLMLSSTFDFKYCVVNFKDSIKKSL